MIRCTRHAEPWQPTSAGASTCGSTGAGTPKTTGSQRLSQRRILRLVSSSEIRSGRGWKQVSTGVVQVSRGVKRCQEVSTGVNRCRQVSRGVDRCQQVSTGVNRCCLTHQCSGVGRTRAPIMTGLCQACHQSHRYHPCHPCHPPHRTCCRPVLARTTRLHPACSLARPCPVLHPSTR